MVTSGIRLGSPAATTRGFGIDEFTQLGHLIGDVLDGLSANREDNSEAERAVKKKVDELCKRFPVY
jgi:glycine hydroxymethyltransferase